MFKFIIITFAIMYLFPRVLRWGIKMFIGNQINKVQNEFKSKQSAETRKEGEIKVEYTRSTPKGEQLKGGEYVDYEEVKD